MASPQIARRWRLGAVVALGCFILSHLPAIRAADKDDVVDAWMDAQAKVHSWSSGFVQTRTLKSLAEPLVSTGKIWFQAPDFFRWEVGGEPAQTIALRNTNQLMIVYPRLKRAEVYAAKDTDRGPWKDTLALMEAGFFRHRRDLDARFKIMSVSTSNATHTVVLEPRASGARRLMPRIALDLRVKDYELLATELFFADGSTMRSDFTNAMVNLKIEASVFHYPVSGDFTVVEPLKKK